VWEQPPSRFGAWCALDPPAIGGRKFLLLCAAPDAEATLRLGRPNSHVFLKHVLLKHAGGSWPGRRTHRPGRDWSLNERCDLAAFPGAGYD